MSQASIEQILSRLDDLRPTLETHVGEADRLAQLPERLVHTLLELRLFRLWIPQRYGGFELELPGTLRIYAAVARIDGSLGWAAMIGAGGGLFAASLDSGTASEIFMPDNAVIAGSGAPDGQAERVPGGYRVSGRWRYASGIDYATTITANCVLTDSGCSVPGADARPLIRAMAFTPSQIAILPTWNPSGMRGTGSHDFEVRDAFVPAHRSFSVFDDAPCEEGPLYRLPFGVLTELPIAAVALGIARHALDAFAALVRQKTERGSGKSLAEDPAVTMQYAESDARWRFAQARLNELALQTWHTALAERPLSAHGLAEITASCVLCVSELQVAIGRVARLAGMNAVMQDDEFARAWRDLQTLGAHISISPRQLLSAGSALLGPPGSQI